jgi:hypothetical protein
VLVEPNSRAPQVDSPATATVANIPAEWGVGEAKSLPDAVTASDDGPCEIRRYPDEAKEDPSKMWCKAEKFIMRIFEMADDETHLVLYQRQLHHDALRDARSRLETSI